MRNKYEKYTEYCVFNNSNTMVGTIIIFNKFDKYQYNKFFFWLDRLWIVLCWTWVIGMVSTPSNLLAWTMEHSMQLGDPLAWQQKLWTQQTHLESFANHNHQERIVYTHRSKCLPINENQMMHMWKGMLTPCIPF